MNTLREKPYNREEYVCGFVSARDASGRLGVLLLRKNRPSWQAGRLNGTGGKLQPDEEACNAMTREWREESMTDLALEWQKIAKLTFFNGAAVHFYKAEAGWEEMRALSGMANDVGEVFEFLDIQAVLQMTDDDMIPNLRWLLPLAFLDTVDQFVTCTEVRRGEPS